MVGYIVTQPSYRTHAATGHSGQAWGPTLTDPTDPRQPARPPACARTFSYIFLYFPTFSNIFQHFPTFSGDLEIFDFALQNFPMPKYHHKVYPDAVGKSGVQRSGPWLVTKVSSIPDEFNLIPGPGSDHPSVRGRNSTLPSLDAVMTTQK